MEANVGKIGSLWIGGLLAIGVLWASSASGSRDLPAFLLEMDTGAEAGEPLPMPAASPSPDTQREDRDRAGAAPGVPQAPVPQPPAAPKTVPAAPSALHERPQALSEQEREYLDELRSLQREVELWGLRNQVLERQRVHSETEAKIRSLSEPVRAPNDSAMPARAGHVGSAYDTHIAEDERALASMRLVSVFGDARDPHAELFFGGARIRVARGDRLPGDWRVVRIEQTRVVAEKGTRQFEIGFDVPGGLTRRLSGTDLLSQ